MEPQVWLENALDELLELSQADELDQLHAWRWCVLFARVESGPPGPTLPDELRARVANVLSALRAPDIQLHLDRLADALEDEDDDTWGPLLDALIDVDDVVGVLQLLGNTDDAVALTQRVAALISLSPERVLPLGVFAEMRVASLREDAPIGRVWRSVEAAPALIFADALPEPRHIDEDVVRIARRTPWLSELLDARRLWGTGELDGAITVQVGVSELERQFSATLGSSSDEPLTLAWGDIRSIAVPIGTRVELNVPNGQVWYRVASGSHSLPNRAWILEAGEAPVLLVVTDSTGQGTLEAALAGGCRAAAAVLTEG